jgi:diacylglycerol kinase (ATP)
MERIFKACEYSLRGLYWAIRSEAAFRQELVVLAAAFPAACLIAPDLWGRVIMIGAILFVMIVELLNTAIEKLCDRITRAYDDEIRRVKDISSAAVGLSIVLALTVWSSAALLSLHIL